MSMMVTREEFLGINRMDADELRETLSEVLENNAKLRALVEGMEWCKIDDADAKFCPLYDEDEPFRCKKERYLKEVGLAEVSDVSINDSQALRSCPFCGGKAEFRSGSSTTPYIRCMKCGGRTKSSRNRANLIAAWNKRAQ